MCTLHLPVSGMVFYPPHAFPFYEALQLQKRRLKHILIMYFGI